MIYLDHAATTPVARAVLEEMLPYFSEVYGNPSSQHRAGKRALAAVDRARDTVAELLGVRPQEIYFTSGGTESDNWALRGVLAASGKGHALLSPIEHPALLETAKALSRQGYAIDYLPVNAQGIVDVAGVRERLRPDTAVVCCMWANNEVGTLQPIEELAALAHANGSLFFTDAVQAMGSEPVSLAHADLAAFSAHKFYGPKGIGVLYVKSGVKIAPILTGGHQERGRRGGTTDTPLIVGLAKALSLALEDREQNHAYVKGLRDGFLTELLSEPGISLNGAADRRLAANANLRFSGVSGESMAHNLDLVGICVSTGSACTSGAVKPSHVLLAMGQTEEQAGEAVRFTFGLTNTKEDVHAAAERVKALYHRLRGETI